MIYINQHICVFLTANELTVEKQKEFFYRMCTALQYDTAKMKSLSAIYACYGLFGGTPLSETDIKRLSRLVPCENCEKLLKKSIYKSLPIKENACRMCIFSNYYLNARENEERIALKHFMMPGKKYEYLQLLPENAFTSIFRLESDYTLGNIPAIPFHLYLYQYLENNSFVEMGNDAFFDGLLHYIQGNMDTLIDVEKYREQLYIYYNNIIRLDDKSVTDDIYEDAASILRRPYMYETPLKPVKPVGAGNPDRKKKKRQSRKKESPNFSTISLGLFDELDDIPSVEENKETVPEQMQTAPVDSTLDFHDTFFPNDSISPAKSMDIMSPMPEQNIPEHTDIAKETSSEQADTDVKPENDTYNENDTDLAMEDEKSKETDLSSDNSPLPEDTEQVSDQLENDTPAEAVPTQNDVDIWADEDDMSEFDFYDNPFEEDDITIEAEGDDPGFPALQDIDAKISKAEEEAAPQSYTTGSAKEDKTESTYIAASASLYNSMTTNPPKTTAKNSSDAKTTFQITDYMDLYAIQNISEKLDDSIIIVSRDETFPFLKDFLSASSIAIESAIYHDRTGFILYMDNIDKFYFYDLQVFGAGMLATYIQDCPSVVITCHPMQLMALLHDTVNNDVTNIHSLDGLYWINADHDEPTIDKLFASNTDTEDCMPRYSALFVNLYESVSSKGLLKEYQGTMKTFHILAQCLIYKKVFHNHKIGITMNRYMHMNFSFDWSETFCNPGTLYRIELPDMGESYYISTNMCTKICHSFQGLHHNSAHHFQLLSITQKAVYWYYEGTPRQAARFYDSIMARLQKLYEREKKQPLSSQTLCVTYQ